MNASEMIKKSDDELKTLIVDSKKELLNLRFQRANGQVDNTARFKQVKKTVARAKTILHKRQLDAKN